MISRRTLHGVASVLAKHLDRATALRILTDLAVVPGNASFRASVEGARAIAQNFTDESWDKVGGKGVGNRHRGAPKT